VIHLQVNKGNSTNTYLKYLIILTSVASMIA